MRSGATLLRVQEVHGANGNDGVLWNERETVYNQRADWKDPPSPGLGQESRPSELTLLAEAGNEPRNFPPGHP